MTTPTLTCVAGRGPTALCTEAHGTDARSAFCPTPPSHVFALNCCFTRVRHTWLPRGRVHQVAVKKLLESKLSPKEMKEFVSEVSLASSVHHPNVVRVYAASMEPKRNLIVMELMGGGTLHNALDDDDNRPSWEMRMRWIKQLTDGLLALHARGIAHRDLKVTHDTRPHHGLARVSVHVLR